MTCGGGILLRRDLHALFDRWLLTIDPDAWTIRVGAELIQYGDLAALRGARLWIEPDVRPDRRYILEHFRVAGRAWGDPS
jgi:hypothetical protein